MNISSILKCRREEMRLGVRELCKNSIAAGTEQQKISPGYYSQIENNSDSIKIEEISIDKLWGIGVALKLHPLALFVQTRRIKEIPQFKLKNSKPFKFNEFIKMSREKTGQGIRKLSENMMNNENCEFTVSSPYLSQIENNRKVKLKRIKDEKLCALGCILNIDPLLLFVLSRELKSKYLKASARNDLFEKMESTFNFSAKFDVLDFENVEIIEGIKSECLILSYSRNKNISEQRKKLDRFKCKACGFKLNYNGKYLIECHHQTPLSEGERLTKLEDLVTLCPTCHKIAHLSKPPLDLLEIKAILNLG